MVVEKPIVTVTMIKGYRNIFDLILHTNNAYREVTQQAIYRHIIRNISSSINGK